MALYILFVVACCSGFLLFRKSVIPRPERTKAADRPDRKLSVIIPARSELEGFGKGAVLSTAKLSARTIVPIALWFAGLVVAGSAVFLWSTPWIGPLLFGYALYAIQLFYLVRYIGFFGKMSPLLHPISTLFFLAVMLYSAYQVVVLGHVAWKGRNIEVGGGKDRWRCFGPLRRRKLVAFAKGRRAS